jgi:hypothetical protein
MEVGLGRGGVGSGPCWLLHQELGAAGGHSASWRRHLVWAVVPPRLALASPPLALRRPPLAAGPPVRFQSVRPCIPTAACVPLSRGCMPQYVGHHLRAPPPAGRSCRRQWCCRVPTGARPRESAARPRSWRRCTAHLPPLSGGLWALGAAYRGHCRYTCMVVSGMPVHIKSAGTSVHRPPGGGGGYPELSEVEPVAVRVVEVVVGAAVWVANP